MIYTLTEPLLDKIMFYELFKNIADILCQDKADETRERVYLNLYFIEGLSPDDIPHVAPNLFTSTRDVYNVRDRLQKRWRKSSYQARIKDCFRRLGQVSGDNFSENK